MMNGTLGMARRTGAATQSAMARTNQGSTTGGPLQLATLGMALNNTVQAHRLSAQSAAQNAAPQRGAVVQRVELNLPHPTKPMERWTVDTNGLGAEYIFSWIDAIKQRKPRALYHLIQKLHGIKKPSKQEKQILLKAVAVFSQIKPGDHPVIGLPGAAYLGPTFPGTGVDKKNAVHRGETEVEMANVEGKGVVPCMRLYMTVANPEKMTRDSVSSSRGASKFKDVQQGQDGSIVISAGGEVDTGKGLVYMNAGQPLRAIKWGAKYEAEHKGKGLSSVIRSFLVPLDDFQKLSANARSQHAEDNLAYEQQSPYGSLENSDQEAAPNQYGFNGTQVEQVRKMALPGSLISYAEDPNKLKLASDDQLTNNALSFGDIRHTGELRERLGLPHNKKDAAIAEGAWMTPKKFAGSESEGETSEQLNRLYVTWQQHLAGDKEVFGHLAAFKPPGKATWQQYYGNRLKELQKYINQQSGLKGFPLDSPEVAAFMNNILLPTASLTKATALQGQDYAELEKGNGLKDTEGTGNHFHLL